MRPKPLVLVILDGWGYRAESKANAIALARKPNYDRILREYPNTLIQTSGPFVRAGAADDAGGAPCASAASPAMMAAPASTVRRVRCGIAPSPERCPPGV